MKSFQRLYFLNACLIAGFILPYFAQAEIVVTSKGWTDNFNQAAGTTLDPNYWTTDIPNSTKANYSMTGSSLQINTTGNTDMWTGRNDAPIIWTTAPEGSYEAILRANNDTRSKAYVTGITVYGNTDGTKPTFSYGNNRWYGIPGTIDFQILGSSTPATANSNDTPYSYRMVFTPGKDGGNDSYAFYYRASDSTPWTYQYTYNANIPNERIGVFQKSSGAQVSTYDYFTLNNIITPSSLEVGARETLADARADFLNGIDSHGTGRWTFQSPNNTAMTFNADAGGTGVPGYTANNGAKIVASATEGMLDFTGIAKAETISVWTAGEDETGLVKYTMDVIADTSSSDMRYVIRKNGADMEMAPRVTGSNKLSSVALLTDVTPGTTLEAVCGGGASGKVGVTAEFIKGTVVGNIGADYVAATKDAAKDAVFTHTGTNGETTGTWTGLVSTTPIVDFSDPNSFKTLNSSYETGGIGTQGFGSGQLYNTGCIANGKLYTDGFGIKPGAEIAVHPGDTMRNIVLRWEPEADGGYEYNVYGYISNLLSSNDKGGNSIEFWILVDDQTMEESAYHIAATGKLLDSTVFDEYVTCYDHIDFVIGDNGGFTADETNFQAWIVQMGAVTNPEAVPEPSTWALLILGALGMMYIRLKKQKP